MVSASIEIAIHPVEVSRITQVDFNHIPFGKIFSDHMFVADFYDGAWQKAEIVPYGKIGFSPAISGLHYGQSVFEGMKAYKTVKGETVSFRQERNFSRMNKSAARLCMPEIPRDIFIGGLEALLRLDKNWIPETEGSSLYIRPIYFAVDELIGVHASGSYKFIILTCPVGAYYTEPVNVLVATKYVRAFEGGVGFAKAAGNYAASMLAAKEALAQGYHNMLWMDGRSRHLVEESGTMNVFFVVDGTAITPRLSGTILDGVTRDSCITLLKDRNIPVEERDISIDDLVAAHSKGLLQEAFGTGTAATIAHIAKIGYEGKDLVLPPVSERKISTYLSDTLSGIKTGKVEDTHHWLTII